MTSRVVDIVLTESVAGPDLFKKLSDPAQQLFIYMSLANRMNNQRLFAAREMQHWPGFDDRQLLIDCLYELESRSFGRVRKDGVAVFFDASIPLLASIKINPTKKL